MATISIDGQRRSRQTARSPQAEPGTPSPGCSHVLAGCDHGYAEAMAKRLQAMGQPRAMPVSYEDRDATAHLEAALAHFCQQHVRSLPFARPG